MKTEETNLEGSPASAVARGLLFLRRRQLPSGQFPIESTMHYQPGAPVVPDCSPFATTHIVHSLGRLPAELGEALIAPALRYMHREMSRFGLWRYWNRDAVWSGRRIHSFIPADLDDTASHSLLLREHGIAFPDNRDLMLLNRNRRGLFYTWFVPRPRLCLAPRYWAALFSELTPARLTVFWRTTEAGYQDVDAVVNANVLLYLGESPETQPVIEWLSMIIRNDEESVSDKWYRDIFTFHYAVSRCHRAGIRGFGPLAERIHAKFSAAACEDGRIGESPMQTALAACALMNYGIESPLVAKTVQYLLATQEPDGSWPSAPFYYGGPKKSVSWGSAELTTGFCLEAIHRASATMGASNA